MLAESPAYGPDTKVLYRLPYKLIARSDGAVLLYDLEGDPAERRDLTQDRPELAEEMQRELMARISQLSQSRDLSGAELDEATKDQLRSLGYVQ